MVELQFFAAAREAVGAATLSVKPGTLSSVLAVFNSPVIARCSFLVNGVAETDLSVLLADDDRVDVLPPFAGG
jgi:sulfur-carrier protein